MQIRGTWKTRQVWMDERELSPERSQAVINYSPTGFGWAYGGSGPAQLALALLLELTSQEMALLWYQEVKREIIAKLPPTDFTLDSQVIIDFIAGEVQMDLGAKAPLRRPGEARERRKDLPEITTSTTTIDVDFPYRREELHAIFACAYAEDVEKGGRYDARSAAINVYSHPWTNEAMRNESTMMGSFYAVWADKNQICTIEIDEGFSYGDLLTELGVLEEKALGRRIYGR